MKKSVFLLLFLFPMLVFSQKAKIEFTKTSHDFGTISENGGSVVHEFEFKNEGNAPLLLTNVRAGCGCTTPEWSRQPIAPGATGKVKVSFNPKYRPGPFVKSITVNSNGDPAVVSLTIRGKVNKKAADPYDAYTYNIGFLKASNGNLNLGSIHNTEKVEKIVDIINSGTNPLTISVIPESEHITASVEPATLAKNEKGKIRIVYDAARKNDWGFVSDKIIVKTDQPEESSFTVSANITEDFSKYKENDYANAPIAVFSEKEAKLGNLTKNTTKKHEFFIQNTGKSDLIIRKIKTSNDNSLTVVPAKTTIKPGKKIKVVLNLKTDDTAGKKIKIASFILNDPKNTIVTYKLIGNVQ